MTDNTHEPKRRELAGAPRPEDLLPPAQLPPNGAMMPAAGMMVPMVAGYPAMTMPPSNLAPPLGQISPMAVLQAARRRWKLALLLGTVCAATTAIISWRMIPESLYTARAILRITHNPKIIFETSEKRQDVALAQRELLVMMRSRTVLNAALGDPELVKLEITKDKLDPIDWLSRQIKVNMLSGEYVEVSMAGENKKILPVIVNAVSKAYMTEVVDRDEALREKRLAELQKIWGTFQDELKAKREMIRKLAEQVGAEDKGSLVMMQQYAMENQNRIQREMLDIESEIRNFEGELTALKGEGKQAPETPDERILAAKVDKLVEKDPGTASAKAKINSINQAIVEMSHRVRSPADPAYIPLRRDLKLAQDALKNHQIRIREEIEESARHRSPDETTERIAQLTKHIKFLTDNKARLQDQFTAFKAEKDAVGANGLDQGREKEQMALAERAAQTVGAEIEAVKV